ncbi:MAG: twin-arginine translocase TatA/TatE family subunit [Planctomycetes bacterium]|nr:twin-arginine translocase TatA/TatE family subunit [Planctomycetota bacterium]
MPLAFIGGTEIIWVVLLGLLLFGGKLPDVARDLGKMFFKAKRTINEIRRDSGIEDAIRDIERESAAITRGTADVSKQIQKAASIPDWRQTVDLAAGPGSTEPEAEANLEPEGEAERAADGGEEQKHIAEDKPDSEPESN